MCVAPCASRTHNSPCPPESWWRCGIGSRGSSAQDPVPSTRIPDPPLGVRWTLDATTVPPLVFPASRAGMRLIRAARPLRMLRACPHRAANTSASGRGHTGWGVRLGGRGLSMKPGTSPVVQAPNLTRTSGASSDFANIGEVQNGLRIFTHGVPIARSVAQFPQCAPENQWQVTKWNLCHLSGNWSTSEKERTCLLNLRIDLARCMSGRDGPLIGTGEPSTKRAHREEMCALCLKAFVQTEPEENERLDPKDRK